MQASPRTDICDISQGQEGSSLATFDQSSGTFTLSTLDIDGIPSGTYTFDIQAQLGSKIFTTTYTIEFKNPCIELPIKINVPLHFNDHTFTLGDAKY